MKSVIKTTIGILAISLAGVSVSQADSNRHNRDYDRAPHKQYTKKFDRRDHKKYKKQQYRGKHLSGNHKNAGWKRHYQEHKRSHVVKKIRHVRYIAPAPRVVYRTHSHSTKIAPVIAGGIIGSSIANHASHGDPAATLGGAIFGAVIGNAISRH